MPKNKSFVFKPNEVSTSNPYLIELKKDNWTMTLYNPTAGNLLGEDSAFKDYKRQSLFLNGLNKIDRNTTEEVDLNTFRQHKNEFFDAAPDCHVGFKKHYSQRPTYIPYGVINSFLTDHINKNILCSVESAHPQLTIKDTLLYYEITCNKFSVKSTQYLNLTPVSLDGEIKITCTLQENGFKLQSIESSNDLLHNMVIGNTQSLKKLNKQLKAFTTSQQPAYDKWALGVAGCAYLGTLLFIGLGTVFNAICGGSIGISLAIAITGFNRIIHGHIKSGVPLAAIGTTGLGASIGALLGTIVFPGFGTAMGAVLGAAIGFGVTGVSALFATMVKRIKSAANINRTTGNPDESSNDEDPEFTGSHAKLAQNGLNPANKIPQAPDQTVLFNHPSSALSGTFSQREKDPLANIEDVSSKPKM